MKPSYRRSGDFTTLVTDMCLTAEADLTFTLYFAAIVDRRSGDFTTLVTDMCFNRRSRPDLHTILCSHRRQTQRRLHRTAADVCNIIWAGRCTSHRST
ncbi:hypothetical protein J6590_047643 [Homalodisca vitripennis]|nr:hypothetical protein J6590_047643 [Homalodisca vitripennis]